MKFNIGKLCYFFTDSSNDIAAASPTTNKTRNIRMDKNVFITISHHTSDLYTRDVLGFLKSHPVFVFDSHVSEELSDFQADL